MSGEQTEFDEAVARVGRAVSAFVTGDPEPFRACWLPGEPTSIFGGRGDHEVGWGDVSARLTWAASAFEGGWVEQDILVKVCADDLGYTVCLERGQQVVAGHVGTARTVLRVTHLYRRRDGAWGLVHRHADPIVERTSAESILVQE